MHHKSIRVRLTLWYTGLTTVTYLLLGAAAYGLLSYNLAHSVDAALNGVARAMIEKAQGGLPAFAPSEIDETFRRFFDFSPWERYLQMLDRFGHVDPQLPSPSHGQLPLSKDALNNASRGLPTYETMKGLGEYPVRVLTLPVMEAGRMTKVIRVGMSLQRVHQTRVRFLVVMALLLPVGLLLAGSGGLILARRALKPVDRMIEASQRIRAEHLSERLQETGADDELDRLAGTLNEMLGRLDAAFAQVRQFSADASHELQTPLTILRGELEVALRLPRTSEEYRRILKSALEEVDRIDRLVEGLLLMSRAEAGVLRMDRQDLDLGQLLQEVHDQLQVLARSRSIELRLGPMASISVRGDRELLRRLLFNLGDNAIKYTEPKGHVTLSLQRQGKWANLSVSDTGMGISSGDQERIFEPFYRTKEGRSLVERGTGLGLSIARSIVMAHGGAIRVESTPGQGSTFRAMIPIGS